MSTPAPARHALPLPAKRYFSGPEVSALCGVQPHVLRQWEQAFAQLRPLKRRRNRRYYSPEDVLLVRRLHTLIHVQGHSLASARELLETATTAPVPAAMPAPDAADAPVQQAPAATPPAPTSAPKAPPTPAPVISAATTTITTPSDTATPAPTSASAVPRQPAATPDWAWVAQELQEIRKLLTPLP